VLLKQEGNLVRAGEVIAIIGDSGMLSTGPHLHFELWFNGNPVNPLDYIVF
jgi:murein DD-endopeptidase MepM/ murein hydrolase activator NlpD